MTISRLGVLSLGVALGGCCGSLPDDIWNGQDFPDPVDTTWRCDTPLGEICFAFYRQGNVVLTEAGGGASFVHNWESDCGGMILYGPFDETSLSGFAGDVGAGSLTFAINRPDIEIQGTAECTLDTIDPQGHSCP